MKLHSGTLTDELNLCCGHACDDTYSDMKMLDFPSKWSHLSLIPIFLCFWWWKIARGGQDLIMFECCKCAFKRAWPPESYQEPNCHSFTLKFIFIADVSNPKTSWALFWESSFICYFRRCAQVEMGACAVVGVYIADLLSGQWKRLSFPYKFSAGKDCGLHGISIMDSLESMKEIGRPKVHLFGTARRQ